MPSRDISEASGSKTLPPLPGPAALLLLLQRDSIHGLLHWSCAVNDKQAVRPRLSLQPWGVVEQTCRNRKKNLSRNDCDFILVSESQRTELFLSPIKALLSVVCLPLGILNCVTSRVSSFCSRHSWKNKPINEAKVLALKRLQRHWNCGTGWGSCPWHCLPSRQLHTHKLWSWSLILIEQWKKK